MDNFTLTALKSRLLARGDNGQPTNPDGLEACEAMDHLEARLKAVEVDCGECGGSGVAEHIQGYDRPCEACGGDGKIWRTSGEQVLIQAVDALTAELKESDAMLGRSSRELERLQSTSISYRAWLDQAKRDAGFEPHTSFDVVWAKALEALEEKRTRDRAGGDETDDPE